MPLKKGVLYMRSMSRLLLSALGVVFVLGGIFLAAIFFDLIGDVGTSLQFLDGNPLCLLLAIIVILLGTVLLTVGLRKGAEEESGSITQFTSLGELRISFKAIESMVLRSARRVKGIRETRTRIMSTEQGLVIFIKVKVLPDLELPPLIEELQKKIQEYVQNDCGTSVAEVKVLVENIALDQSISQK
ncbi:MAG: alkaline shock response membrane anchor protein AmaP [Firmicutes bacterium]|nr:alkaline shock response membrane anchor protein AmaP [Bacillota bacterium]